MSDVMESESDAGGNSEDEEEYIRQLEGPHPSEENGDATPVPKPRKVRSTKGHR